MRKVVGGKPAIIAKKIDSDFYDGDNYFEVDVDVSSSSIAKNILRVVKSYAKKITFDMAWGFEGKEVEHLPEYVGVRRRRCSLLHAHANFGLGQKCLSAKCNRVRSASHHRRSQVRSRGAQEVGPS